MHLVIAVAVGFGAGIAAVLVVGNKVIEEVRRGRSELTATVSELLSKFQKQ